MLDPPPNPVFLNHPVVPHAKSLDRSHAGGGGAEASRHTVGAALLGVALAGAAPLPALALHLPEPALPGPVAPPGTPVATRVLAWLGLFFVASAFHSAETAITTLWPWKVPLPSPFHLLDL